jgi:TolB protein
LRELEAVTVSEGNETEVILKMELQISDNSPPTMPQPIFPTDGEIWTSNPLTLTWSSHDVDDSDELTFDVLLFDNGMTNPTYLLQNSPDTSVELTHLEYGKTYFWQVIAKDDFNDPVNSSVWHFSTRPFPDHRFFYANSENGVYNVFSSDGEGDVLQLTNGTASSWRPRMNAQRDRIAFISNAGIEPHLYTMDRNGNDVVKVTNISIASYNDFELDYCWSPDGTKLLYMHFDRLYLINKDGTGLVEFAEAPAGEMFAEVVWSGVTDKIAVRTVGSYSYESKIYLMNSFGQITETIVEDLPGTTEGPVFSINGRKILYTHDVSEFESPDGRQLDTHIFMMDLESGGIIDLSGNKPVGSNDLEPRFSSTGAFIIFTNMENDGNTPKNIHYMDLEGNNRTLLFENAEMPEWQ